MTKRAADGGYILVAVLSVMVLLTGFMAAGSILVRSTLRGATIAEDMIAMDGLARSGLEITAYQLIVRRLPTAMVDGRRIRLTGGGAVPHVVDEGGKADLNSSDPKLLANLFLAAGLDTGSANGLVSKIVAFRGADRASAAPRDPLPAFQGGQTQGTTIVPTSIAGPQQNATRLRGFQTIEQIRDFGDLSPADFRRVAPWLTVYNPEGKIDVLAASPDLLAAIPGLTPPVVAQILARRGDPTKDNLDALQALLGDAANDTKTTAGPAYTVTIDALGASGQRKSVQAVVAASKSPNDPYLILDWRDGS